MQAAEAIREFIATRLLADGDASALTDTYPLIESGIVDSFGVMSLMTYVEETLGVKFDNAELLPENFETIAAIAALVDRKRGALTKEA
jgi:acyl carrier protein